MSMKQKIVFLDASTLDYGDIDLSPLKMHGELVTYGQTRPSETAARLAGAVIAISNKVVLDREVLVRCPSLRFIAVAATGYNNIDVAAARERGIGVANVAGYSTPSVAQFTMLFILALASRLTEYSAASRDGRWSASPIYTLGNWPTMELAGKVLGILGLGVIGSEVARLARAFGMEVVALRRPGVDYDGGVPRHGLLELAGMADFVSVHMPLTEESRHIVDGTFLAAMKRSAFLVNMARGPLVDPAALADALASGTIAGAAIDVMEKEPPDAGDPLLKAPNIIITPHISWATLESRRRLVAEIGRNIAAFMAGETRNIVG
ncbi:MAG TPA: D-2-hydroxyacid dehydrogenase [Spirochaetota bacterium]|nr:D-2-hydroxyacid dehydrogenase [Spirochaetota bacterium]